MPGFLDELYALIGFKVEGVDKLKAAGKAFAAVKKDVVAVANPLKVVGTTSAATAVAVGKLGAEGRKSSRGMLLLSTALVRLRGAGRVAVSFVRQLLLVLVRFAPALFSVVTALGAVALGFARAGAAAAKARKEFRLSAQEIGTTGQNLETFGSILKTAGFGDGFAEEAKKVVGAVDEIAKTIRKGGDDALEARKKFQGYGIDTSFNVDPATGKSRDSAAIALDIFQAYKRATEQAVTLRKQADEIGKKAPRRASALRKKAIEQDRKADNLAENGGISGRLKVLLDNITAAELPRLIAEAARLFPTTSNASEAKQSDVAKQAEQAGLKVDALLKGTTDRLTEIGVALATVVLPPLNTFLDKLLVFGKATGLIKESAGEKASRLESERETNRAKGFGGTSPSTANEVRRNSYQDYLDRLYGKPVEAPLPPVKKFWNGYRQSDNVEDHRGSEFAEWFKKQSSSGAVAAKMQGAAESKTDQRKYENIGNDQRTMSPNVTVNATGLDAVASAVKNAVLGAISTKGANTSTGALTAP